MGSAHGIEVGEVVDGRWLGHRYWWLWLLLLFFIGWLLLSLSIFSLAFDWIIWRFDACIAECFVLVVAVHGILLVLVVIGRVVRLIILIIFLLGLWVWLSSLLSDDDLGSVF